MRDTIEMALEAGFQLADKRLYVYDCDGVCQEEVERLVALARADERSIEREACAKVCEDQKYMILEPLRTYSAHDICDANKRVALYLSKAIRARGE